MIDKGFLILQDSLTRLMETKQIDKKKVCDVDEDIREINKQMLNLMESQNRYITGKEFEVKGTKFKIEKCLFNYCLIESYEVINLNNGKKNIISFDKLKNYISFE